MPSTVTHIIVGTTIGYIAKYFRKGFLFWFLVILCSIIADFDVIAFKYGIKYSDPFGHRGFFHSFFFAFILSLFLSLFLFKTYTNSFKQYFNLCLILFAITASHAILDGFTNGGLGIAYLAPFNNKRFFFDYRPIQVAPIGIKRFFSSWGLRVIKNEFIYIWIPCFILISLSIIYKIIYKFINKFSEKNFKKSYKNI